MGWSQNNTNTNIISWTYSNVLYNSQGVIEIPVINRVSTTEVSYEDRNKTFENIRYNFSDSPTFFNKEKNYQFNTIVTNYYQQQSDKFHFSPPLYMITPLGLEKDVISNKLYFDYPKPIGNSDTAYYPHPFFTSINEINKLNSTGYGIIFCLHYYSNPIENLISYKQNNSIHYLSNSLFGNIFPNNKNNSDEGIVSFNINEINWLIQGYSSTSLYRINSNNEQIFDEKYWLDSNSLLTGGTLFGKGWYSYPNNTYIWLDGYFNYDIDYEKRWHKSYPSMFEYDDVYDMRNQPVGGPLVGNPIVVTSVSDSDAQAFLIAAGITDTTQKNAINTLVTDLKSAGIWTKMKALYPFVGGTADSHKWNLKDPRDLDDSFRLTFTGVWKHTSTGAQSDGSTGYANLNIKANQIFTSTDGLIGIYTPSPSLKPSSSSLTPYIYGVSNGSDSAYSMIYDSTLDFKMYPNTVSSLTTLPGFSAIGVETTGDCSVYKNNLRLTTSSVGFAPMTQDLKMYLSARNANGTADNFAGALYSFSFISSTLTPKEYSAFYTAVQKYQTTLSRQVEIGSILNGTVKTPHEGFRENNYLAKYVNMDRYNLSMTYKNQRGDNTGVRIYTSSILPSKNPIQSTSKNVTISSNGSNKRYYFDNLLLDNVIELRIKLNIECDFIGGLILNLKSQNGKIINIFNGIGGESNFINTTFTFNFDKKQISTILENEWSSIGNSLFSIQGDMDLGILNSNKSNTRNFKDFNNGTFTLLLEHTLGYKPKSLDCSLITIYDEFLSNTPIAHLTQSSVETTYNFYGIEGNKYLVLVADKIQSNYLTHSIVTLKDLNISNSYHFLNNSQISIISDSFYPIGLSGSTYSYKSTIGSGNTIDGEKSTIELNTMVGTGRFTSGIWENGNWVNGWRDSEICEFFNINNFYSYNRDKKWIFSLYGPNESVSKLNIGDKISISNIVAIDINDRRTLMKNYFTIIDKTYSTIVVEFTWEFPLRRIERDSDNHFINVSKNVWLNGYFFNGRFNGIWNDGVVKGYPFLTKLEKTHWIDGDFDGGHFKSRLISKTASSNNLSNNSNKLKIKFDYPHKLNVGEKIYINENSGKSSNVFGKTKIINIIDSNNILVDITYSNSFKNIINKILYITVYKSDGLIQNMNFNSLNVSESISSESMDSRTLFSFNSWMDLVYDSSSATNILKPQSNYDDSLSRYSENNLYGWITKDVLSSTSTFRDSFSNTIRTYKLGYKYEEVYDYIGNTSYFNEYFLPNSTEFEDLGWKRTTFTQSGLTFSRTIDDGTDKLILGKELKVDAYKDGGVLNITDPKITIKNREISKINDGRYTMVSFDLINKKTTYEYYSKVEYKQPLIHFSNINIVNKKGVLLKATYLPVNKNVDHLKTDNKNKIEYFYNKKDLMMNFRGSGTDGLSTSTYIIDNLKFYETNMVPFFQYFNYSNINRSIQIPIHIKKYKSVKDDYNYDLIDYTYFNNLNSLVYSDTDKENYINLPRFKDLYEIPNYNNFENGYDWNNTNFGNDTNSNDGN